MANNFEVSKKILDGLTGQVGVDKKYLIDNIYKLRAKKENFSADIAVLGMHLYSILLDNGLNESDVINTQRLLDKVDGLIYEDKFDSALEILEVLDSLEEFRAFGDDGSRVYNFSNSIEAELAFQNAGAKTQRLDYLLSMRSYLVYRKASTLYSSGDIKQAEKLLNQLLTFNPVNFDGLVLKALITKIKSVKNLEKYKQLLLDAYNFAYSPAQVVLFLQLIADYYADKEDFYGAICCLLATTLYADPSLVEERVFALAREANKRSVKQMEIPRSDEIKRFLEREEIPRMVSEQNAELVYCCLRSELSETEVNSDYVEFLEDTLTQIFGSDDVVKAAHEKIRGDK